MSVVRRMLGRELPCTLADLLAIPVPVEAVSREKHSGFSTRGSSSNLQIGLAHLDAGRFGLARQALHLAVQFEPNCPSNRIAMARVYEALADHYQSAIQLEAALAYTIERNSSPARASLLLAAAFAWERSGHWRPAVTRHSQAIAEQPDSLFARHRLIAIQLAHGRLDDAINQLKSLLTHSPADQTARVCLGHLLQRNARYAEAAWEYEQALCLEPDSWEMPVDVARQLHLTGSSDDAIRILERLIGAQPHFPDLRMRLANLYSQNGDDTAALAEFERALSYHPDYLDCHISMAKHELRMGRVESAAQHYRHSVAINNQHVEVYVGLALALHHCGRTSQAGEIFASAGRIANNSAILIAQLGSLEFCDDDSPPHRIEMSAERVGQQIAKDQAIFAAHPRWNDVRVRMAMLLRLLGKRKEAMAMIRHVTSEEPAYGQAWMQLGLLHADRAARKKAIAAFSAALKIDSNRLEPEYQLALIYCGTAEFELTVDKIERLRDNEDILRRVWVTIDGLRLEADRSEPGSDVELAGRES